MLVGMLVRLFIHVGLKENYRFLKFKCLYYKIYNKCLSLCLYEYERLCVATIFSFFLMFCFFLCLEKSILRLGSFNWLHTSLVTESFKEQQFIWVSLCFYYFSFTYTHTYMYIRVVRKTEAQWNGNKFEVLEWWT